MDYTTAALLTDVLTSGDEPVTIPANVTSLIARLVTAASRAVDRFCANAEIENYFARETLTSQKVQATIDHLGVLRCWPPKPNVVSVSAASWALRPIDTHIDLDVTNKAYVNGAVVEVYDIGFRNMERVSVRMSYVGGYGVAGVAGALPTGLPADIVECTTVLAARFFKEDSTGLNDAIGVAELGVIIYSKAWPVRVKDQLKKYVRQVPL